MRLSEDVDVSGAFEFGSGSIGAPGLNEGSVAVSGVRLLVALCGIDGGARWIDVALGSSAANASVFIGSVLDVGNSVP